jgi:hypothetical protein
VKGRLGSNAWPFDRKFVQIAINPSAHANFTRHRAAVTRRWNVPAAINPVTGVPIGRDERRGDFDVTTKTFSKAGKTINFTPHPDRPWEAQPASFLERVCENGDFLVGVLEEIAQELQDFVDSGGQVVGGTALAAVAAAATGSVVGSAALLTAASFLAALAILILAVVALAAAIKELVEAAASGAEDVMPRLGSAMDDARKAVFNSASGPAGVFVWQMIAYKVFESQQENHQYSAISYAVMDIHNYLDRSCSAHGDSIEVFFDATDSRLPAFVDAVLTYESMQQVQHGRAMVGYLSLRFTGRTRALLGMQRWRRTCAIEIAGLLDVEGSKDLIDFAIRRSRNLNVGGILHWGQRMDGDANDIEARYGSAATPPRNELDRWRTQLGVVTQGGSFKRFSSAFSRQFGLEI